MADELGLGEFIAPSTEDALEAAFSAPDQQTQPSQPKFGSDADTWVDRSRPQARLNKRPTQRHRSSDFDLDDVRQRTIWSAKFLATIGTVAAVLTGLAGLVWIGVLASTTRGDGEAFAVLLFGAPFAPLAALMQYAVWRVLTGAVLILVSLHDKICSDGSGP